VQTGSRPDLGVDEDVKQSMNNLAESEKELSRTMRTPAWSTDYSGSRLSRTDLGTDQEIQDLQGSLQSA